MEQLNKLTDAAIIQLAQQRRLRREPQEPGQQEPGQEGVRIVDADPSVQESQSIPASPLPMKQTGSTRRRSLPQLPASPGVVSAPWYTPAVSCPLCKDQGFVRADVQPGHPLFGKPIMCKCKKERKKDARRQQLREQSKLDDLAVFQDETFESFQFWLPGVGDAYEVAKQYAETPQGWLVLSGNNGCGKTHLAVAIAKCCLEDGKTVLFAVVPDLLDRLRSAFAPTADESFDAEFAKMREVEVLVLDDLGAESSTNWAVEKLFQLLNYRYNARLATVFTTNKIGFEGIAPRLRSRLSDRRLVRTITLVDAQDFREMELGQ